MRTFDEQQIVSMAPNANAVANGRKLSSGGSFIKRMRSSDDSLYFAECKGSGKSNYNVSIDFEKENEPVFRCSCPSRQFPCKHAIGLMFEMKEGKTFEDAKIPQDILDKRNKIEEREKKKAKKEIEKEQNPDKTKKTSAASKAAKTKKIKKQIDGLDLLKDVMIQITNSGVASFVESSFDKKYDELAKQLGDYYLPGVQLIFKRFFKYLRTIKNSQFIDEIRKNYPKSYVDEIRKDYPDDYMEEYLLALAVKELTKLRYIEKRARDYLNKKLESDEVGADDNILYEALGGVWKLEELGAIGLKKDNAELVQLSFTAEFDSVKGEDIDTGYWIDLDTGEIDYTANYCPVKAKKYITRGDSFFGKKCIDTLYYYPANDGENRRIRYESSTDKELSVDDIKKIRGFAKKNISEFLKSAKNVLKATLSDNLYAVLFEFARIGQKGNDVVVEDSEGAQILLKSKTFDNTVIGSILNLPGKDYLHGQVLFGLAYYDFILKQICIEPRSIISDKEILRLAF